MVLGLLDQGGIALSFRQGETLVVAVAANHSQRCDSNDDQEPDDYRLDGGHEHTPLPQPSAMYWASKVLRMRRG
ncbi:hypothetical protein D3C79_903230 [compost metagenome]